MNAFRNIDALLLVFVREKALLKFLFTGRKAPVLRQEQALENFMAGYIFRSIPTQSEAA